MFYCIRLPCLQSGNQSESNIFLFSICLMTRVVDIFLHCGEYLVSNIGLVIERPDLCSPQYQFPHREVNEALGLRRGSGTDERSVARVVCRINVKKIMSRKCQDNIRANKT